MKLTRRLWRAIAPASIALALAACDSKPFEKAGKSVDRAMEKTGDKIKEITK